MALEPRPLRAEIEFLLRHAGRYLTRQPVEHDILSAFAGLRPLVTAKGRNSTARLSRAHTLLVSPARLVTITGGKWTTYRQMAEDAPRQQHHLDRIAGLPARSHLLLRFAAAAVAVGRRVARHTRGL